MAAPMAFILPPLCVLRLQNEPVLRTKNTLALFTLIFGACVIMLGIVVLLMDISKGVRCYQGENLGYCDFMYPNQTDSRFLCYGTIY
ncbi:hypothetical protein Ciccas_005528 [Cichlidogyrus casuarinus]|uniref:Uncharacterized protein n=1 Tax=Cichlidogyrus casuarinus TaxID=1844966 RepID=A0ABD2Q9C4_9PLAT